MANVKDLCLGRGERELLFANGQIDRADGKHMYQGWQEVAEMCGYTPHARTPAREAYEDGYYAGTPSKTQDA